MYTDEQVTEYNKALFKICCAIGDHRWQMGESAAWATCEHCGKKVKGSHVFDKTENTSVTETCFERGIPIVIAFDTYSFVAQYLDYAAQGDTPFSALESLERIVLGQKHIDAQILVKES